MSQTNHKPLYRLSAFRGLSKVNTLISRIMEGLHSAVFMGVIDDTVLQEYDTYPFGNWEGASEVVGNAKGVESWLETFITNEVTPESRVLVVGAGGGDVLLRLQESGCSVTGVEFDEELFSKTTAMLEGQSVGSCIEFHQVERYQMDAERRDFDLVVIPRFYTSYVQGRSARIGFLRECRERLGKGGVIAFDYFIRPESRFSPGSLIFKVQPCLSNLLRFVRGGKKRSIETGDHLDPHVPLLHHHYNEADLSHELSEAGLSSVERGTSWFGWSVAKGTLAESQDGEPLRASQAKLASPVPEISHS